MSTGENSFANLFFQSTPCLPAHVHALKADADSYIKELRFLWESGTFAVLSSGVRARILAALHITAQHKTVTALLEQCEVTDIVKAATLLDRPRTLRQLCQKIQRIEDSHPNLTSGDDDSNENDDTGDKSKKRKRVRKVDVYRRMKNKILSELQERHELDHGEACMQAHADTAVTELIQSSSVSGAFARKVRNWAKTCLRSDFLEFAMLALPSDPWRSLADLVHFSPGDFCVPYFLTEVHEGGKKKRKDTEDNGDDSERNGGAALPVEMTFVSRMRKLVKESDGDCIEEAFFGLALDFPQVYLSYSFIRTQPSLMSRPIVVEDLASRVPLDVAIWYFEELFEASPRCGSILFERLQGSDDIQRSVKSKATYGKLVERILTFRRMRPKFEANVEQMVSDLGFSRLQAAAALRRHDGDVEMAAEWVFEDPGAVEAAVEEEKRRERREGTRDAEERAVWEGVRGIADGIVPIAGSRLDELKAYWKKGIHAKVAVFGDASESMQRAIEAATIFASMVSACFDAELSFFSYELVQSPHEKPSSVQEALQVCDRIRASGCTTPAAALWPYYKQKKSMDMFVLVTDEYENNPFNGHHFAELLAKYKVDVNNDVTLVLVCVGKGCTEFRQSIANHNIDYRVVYIDESRPDLAKFDALIGQLAMVSSRRALSSTVAEEEAETDKMKDDNEDTVDTDENDKDVHEEIGTDDGSNDEMKVDNEDTVKTDENDKAGQEEIRIDDASDVDEFVIV